MSEDTKHSDGKLSTEYLRAKPRGNGRASGGFIAPNLAAPVDAAAIVRIQADHDGDGADAREGEGRDPSS